MPRRQRKYHYIYKTTCSLTKRYYYGMHSTDNLKDKYIGSGSELSRSIKKYGREKHFIKILEYLDNRKKLKKRETEIINEEMLQDPMCMNLCKGGGDFNTIGLVSVKDKNGNTFSVSINDPRYLSGEFVTIMTNIIVVKDKNGNTFSVSKDDPRYLSGELVGVAKGFIPVKDKNGNTFSVSKDDPRYLSGELVGLWTGKKHREETKRKIGEKSSIHQKGNGNSQYGTCWITNGLESKKLNKNGNIPKVWRLGRK